MESSRRFAVLLCFILAGGVVVHAWNYIGEARVERKELKDFPKQVDGWQQFGSDQKFSTQVESILGATDYLMRDYRSVEGHRGNFYVGYYASQRDGATYHSPLNCLPGSGWIMSNPGKVTITPQGKPAFEANRYLIQNGDSKELLIYWYQGRGRAVASEYWGKIYTVMDSVRLRRSDAAMVRVMVPVKESETAALQTAGGFAASVSALLPEFIPD